MVKENIMHYRGDTLERQIVIYTESGEIYTPSETDIIRFGIRDNEDSDEYVVYKEIDTNTMLLRLESEDTQFLRETSYVYDIELQYQTEEGRTNIETFLKGKFKLEKDVVRK